MGFIGLIPFILAMIGFVIAVLAFIGICLVIIGGTGIAMNRIYAKQTQAKSSVPKTLHNASSIFFGAVLILFPVGYLLYGIISAVLK